MVFINTIIAQSSFSGKVIDEDGKGIFFTTIALYKQVDSTIYKTATSKENGAFDIKGLKDGDYYLEVSMLGYKKVNINNFSFPKDNERVVNVSMEIDSKMLSTVEIKAKKPLLEQQSDRLIVNVEDNITGMDENLMDVMKKVPGVIKSKKHKSSAGEELRRSGKSYKKSHR